MTVFEYKEESLGPNKGKIKRPVADLSLKTQTNSWIEFHPYIDSGADITMIPLSLGRLLGWHIDEKKVEQIGGIRGSVPVIYAHSQMRLGLQEFPVKIAWALVEEVPPLLGRENVFERFDITFKQHEGIIIFEARNV